MFSASSNLATSAARRALGANTDALQTAMQRLSSGLRVASARDDAAGLAIAERLTAQLRGGNQALRNTNDGISLAQTADGALGAVVGRLQRMRELAVQALGGTSTAADLRAIDAEVQQQRAELDRTAASTRFNGHALLDGSFGSACFQIGAGSGDRLDVSFDASMRSADLGAIAIATSSDLRTVGNRAGGFAFAATYTTVPIADLDFSRPEVRFSGGALRTVGTPASDYSGGGAAQFTVDGAAVNLSADYGSLAGVAGAVQAQLNAAHGGWYAVTQDGARLSIAKTAAAASATTAPQVGNASGANAAAFVAAAATAGTAAARTSNAGFSVDGHRVALVADHSGDFAGLLADIQRQLDAGAHGAYRVSGSSGGNGGISITRTTGLAPPRVDGWTDAGASVFASAPQSGLTLAGGDLLVQVGNRPPVAVVGTFLTPAALAAGIRAQVGEGIATAIDDAAGTLELAGAQTITLSGGAADPSGALAFAQLVNPPGGSLDNVDATAREPARRSLLRIDAAIDAVNAERAHVGALQSRFDSIGAGLQQQAGLIAGARGRIVDADFAAESAQVARSQVLQQAAQAMVAQANLHAQDVLALLR